jgi:hypothetical protein
MEIATMNADARIIPTTADIADSDAPQRIGTSLAKRVSFLQVRTGVRSIVPYGQFVAQRLGRAGIVGVALLVFSAVAFVATNTPLRDQIAADSATLERLSQEAGRAPATATPNARYEEFLRGLPTRDDLPALMQQIVVVAASQNVSLEEGKYEVVASSKSGGMARYRMSFPVTGSYPQIRGFIDGALLAVPSMSLDGLRLRRKDIGIGIVAAELDFVVFVRTSK